MGHPQHEPVEPARLSMPARGCRAATASSALLQGCCLRPPGRVGQGRGSTGAGRLPAGGRSTRLPGSATSGLGYSPVRPCSHGERSKAAPLPPQAGGAAATAVAWRLLHGAHGRRLPGGLPTGGRGRGESAYRHCRVGWSWATAAAAGQVNRYRSAALYRCAVRHG